MKSGNGLLKIIGKKIIFSNESMIMLAKMKVNVWKKARERGYVSHKPRSVYWYGVAISWFGSGTVASVDGKINANKYKDIVEDNPWPDGTTFSWKELLFSRMILPRSIALDRRSNLHSFIPLLSWLAHSPDTNIIEYLSFNQKQSRKQNINS